MKATDWNKRFPGRAEHPAFERMNKTQAKEIILNALAAGDVESEQLIKLVMANGICERTATDARKELRAAGKIDTHNPERKGFRWFLCRTI